MYKHLKDTREDADMNQTEVAKYLGMSQSGYSKYETAKTTFLPRFLSIFQNFGTSVG